MAQFNQGTYKIYQQKETNGDTPLSPQSPTNDIASSPKNNNSLLRKGAMIAIGVGVARRGLSAFQSEIVATTGNEELQSKMNNVMKIVGYGTAVAIAPIAGTIMVASDLLIQNIVNQRAMNRQNKMIEMNNKLKGKRASIASGVGYYG